MHEAGLACKLVHGDVRYAKIRVVSAAVFPVTNTKTTSPSHCFALKAAQMQLDAGLVTNARSAQDFKFLVFITRQSTPTPGPALDRRGQPSRSSPLSS